MQLNTILKILKENNLSVFTSLDLQRFLSISEIAAQKIVERYTKKKIFICLKKRYYILKDRVPPTFFIANSIYRPSYISFESALSYYGVIPESIYSIISATPKITRTFKTLGRNFAYIKIKRQAFVGYHKKEINGEGVLIAEPEKALADYFYLASLGKKRVSERLNLKNISQKKVFNYIDYFERKTLKKFLSKYL